MSIVILVPKLGRPERNEPLLDSVALATEGEFCVMFICSPGDDAAIESCRSFDAHDVVETIVTPFELTPGDYAKKINLGYRVTTEPWLFQAADDLEFHRGWDSKALNVAWKHPGAGVIGTNDMGNPKVKRGLLSTHSLISRTYIDERGGSLDGPGVVLHEGYAHNFVDEELCGLARARGAFQFSTRSKVEHLHPHWRKGELDETYERGLEDFAADRKLFARRRRRFGRPRHVRA